MTFGILVERREHYRQYGLDIVAYQIAEVLVIPEVKSPLCDLTLQSVMLPWFKVRTAHLKMRTGNRFCQLIEQRLLHFGKFCWIHHFKYVLNFIQEHHFFSTVDLRPVPEETQYDLKSTS